ncbi:MAG TPA: SDR family NAD(P)-dependent oxidoreductase [Solirubrobacteraceae bacterium]
MGELDGKVAVITGSGRGIGEAAARKLAANGARVVVSDVDRGVAERVAAQIGGVAHVGDLVTHGACDELIDAAITSFGQLDIVVNNAGVHRVAALNEITDEQMQQMLDIHTIVPMRVLRAAGPYLQDAALADLAAGREVFRKVVNVSSLAGVMGIPGQAAYAAAKAGAIGLTRSLAKEWGALKINVNAVAFGMIETRMTADLPDSTREAVAQLIPLGRGGTPDEAADGIYYLCSPQSNYVHGQVLAVSGGITFGMAG